jgi:hypothetical protein
MCSTLEDSSPSVSSPKKKAPVSWKVLVGFRAAGKEHSSHLIFTGDFDRDYLMFLVF